MMARMLVPTIALVALIGCGSSDGPQQQHAPTADAAYRERLGNLKYQRDKLRLTISRLEKDRADIVARLRAMGIESTSDLKSHPDWIVHARELKEVVGSISKTNAVVNSFDAAIVRIESILRRADRDNRAEYSALTEADLNELAQTFHETEEALKSSTDIPGVEALELESLLEQELQIK